MKNSGVNYALLAYTWWGVSPLYWQAISFIPPLEIIAHRAFWAAPLMLGFLYYAKKLSRLKSCFNPGDLLLLALTAILVSVNWLVFVWAVHNARLVEASFAYFVYPLAVAAVGVILLKEKLAKGQILALFVAMLAVILLFVNMQGISWVVLIIVFTFVAYTYIHKISSMDAALSLTIETVMLMPLAAMYFVFLDMSGSNQFQYFSLNRDWLIPLSGFMTALPLFWMISASKLLNLTTLGILFYINPSLQFLVGVFVFDEPVEFVTLSSFILTWCAIFIFTIYSPPKPGNI